VNLLESELLKLTKHVDEPYHMRPALLQAGRLPTDGQRGYPGSSGDAHNRTPALSRTETSTPIVALYLRKDVKGAGARRLNP